MADSHFSEQHLKHTGLVWHSANSSQACQQQSQKVKIFLGEPYPRSPQLPHFTCLYTSTAPTYIVALTMVAILTKNCFIRVYIRAYPWGPANFSSLAVPLIISWQCRKHLPTEKIAHTGFPGPPSGFLGQLQQLSPLVQ